MSSTLESLDTDPTLTGLTEMALKRPDGIRSVARRPEQQPRVILYLLLIGLAGIALFSLAFTVILSCAPGLEWMPRISLGNRTLLRPILTYSAGMAGALGLCLPSFYFYGLLAGVRASMLQVTAISLHAFAKSGMVLMGLLPIYVGAVLGLIVLGATGGPFYPLLIGAGILLPFLAGLASLKVMYDGFTDFVHTLPEDRAASRAPMVRLLAAAWGALYAVVAPVTLWAVHTRLERLL